MKYLKTIFITTAALLFFTAKIEASLEVHPNIIIDTVYAGGNNTSILHITNVGPVPVLDYQLSADVIWISFSSTIGTINEGDTVEIEISYDVSFLQSGTN